MCSLDPAENQTSPAGAGVAGAATAPADAVELDEELLSSELEGSLASAGAGAAAEPVLARAIEEASSSVPIGKHHLQRAENL